MVKDALRHLKATGSWVGAVPERSAVGESKSNGRTEMSVQQVEDLVRCFKAELEHNIRAKIVVEHAVLKWLVECVSIILTKYHLQDDGRTAYEALHGHKASEKLA